MADLTLTSPVATRTVELDTTVTVIEVPLSVAGGVSAIYATCDADWRMQVQSDLQSLAAGATAPTGDYYPVPAETAWPIPVAAHHSGIASRLPVRIAVWVPSGTATLHLQPYPVTR